MYTLPVSTLRPGMVLYEDLYTSKNQLLLKANTLLTENKINLLKENDIENVTLAEPLEINISHYEYLHNSEYFKNFTAIYNESVSSFSRLLHVFETGLDINTDKCLSLRDDILHAVRNKDQLLDYLYNLMANENQLTYIHCFNCGLLCYTFAEWCGFPKEDLDLITLCGFFFDVGKIKLSDRLLWKDGKLTPEEMIQMQHHIHMGYDLIRNKNLPSQITSVLIMHHERCDGSGYPAGLKKERIHPYALLAGIADTYEAVTHPRAQRTAMTPFQAIEVFEKQGLHKFGEENAKKILSHIAVNYLDRRVVLNNGLSGRVAEIHASQLSRPTIYCENRYIDLREHPEITITRMN